MRLPPRTRPGAFAARALGRRVTIDGHKFPSFTEARRYEELKLALKAGAIEWLKVHPRYRLEVNGVHVADYAADFEYIDRSSGAKVVEDVKGWTVKKVLAIRGGKLGRIRQVNVDWRLAQVKIRLAEALYGFKVVVLERR